MKHVIVLLDISYSMKDRAKNMINGLNQFVHSLQNHQKSDSIYLSVVLFCDKCTYVYKEVPVIYLTSPFTTDIIPDYGLTYLYDAIGEVINMWINEPRAQHNLFIITDGEDTGSKRTNKDEASQMCEMAIQNNGWTVTHCDVDISKLNCESINKVVYDVNNLELLLGSLSI